MHSGPTEFELKRDYCTWLKESVHFINFCQVPKKKLSTCVDVIILYQPLLPYCEAAKLIFYILAGYDIIHDP